LELLLNNNISIMFPEADFNSLDDAVEKVIIDPRVFSSDITREQVETLNFSESDEIGIEVYLMLEHKTSHKGNTLRRLKFYMADGFHTRQS